MTKANAQFQMPRMPYHTGPSKAAAALKVHVKPDLAADELELPFVVVRVRPDEARRSGSGCPRFRPTMPLRLSLLPDYSR